MICCVGRKCCQNRLVAVPDIAEFTCRHRAGHTSLLNGQARNRAVLDLDIIFEPSFAAASVGTVSGNAGYQLSKLFGLFRNLISGKIPVHQIAHAVVIVQFVELARLARALLSGSESALVPL